MKLLTILPALLTLLWTVSCLAQQAATQVEALLGTDCVLQLQAGGKPLCHVDIGSFNRDWQGYNLATVPLAQPSTGEARHFTLKTGGGEIRGELTCEMKTDGLHARYLFVPLSDVWVNTLHVSMEFPIEALAGTPWTADQQSGTFPGDFGAVALFSGKIKALKLAPRGVDLALAFATPTAVLLQDNRQWGPSFSVRIGPQAGGLTFKRDEAVEINFVLAAPGGLKFERDSEVELHAGPEWIPLKTEADIEAGSALDFTDCNQRVPAGKLGRVIARRDGQFAFEKDARVARRFYGANLCFAGQYLSHADAERLAERLARLGYNALRIHHYEGMLIEGQANSTTLNPQRLDQLEYLLAACGKRGLYATTDLYVSRPVPNKELGFDKPGNVAMDDFKILVPVQAAAWENWKAFARALLTHVNPYTGLRNADDPCLAWLSMINEGNLGNFAPAISRLPEWKTAWNTWLAKRYHNRAALAAAWGKALNDGEDFANGSIPAGPEWWSGNTPRTRDLILFLSETECEMMARMTRFLRDEIKCGALLTNTNAWTNHLSDQPTRALYDYVDDHFYVDHPAFLASSWQLPSRCENRNPIASGATGGRSAAFTRLLDKPMVITEYNYAAPGRYRGSGGMLTGALGALQGWGGLWRFAYTHEAGGGLKPTRLNYFDVAADPLAQAAERAALCLFLRGDLAMAPHAVGITLTEDEARTACRAEAATAAKAGDSIPQWPAWSWVAWVTRLGMQVVSSQSKTELTVALPAGPASRAVAEREHNLLPEITPFAADQAKLLAALKERGILSAGNATQPEKLFFTSETGEITIDGLQERLLIDTPRTVGGFALPGQTLATADGRVSITVLGTDATVWVSALDAAPIAESKRLLVTHLTDLQDSGMKFGERARRTLLKWGELPHLVCAGQATVRLRLRDATAFQVWAVATSGRRLAPVPVQVKEGVLEFTADVAGDSDNGARMTYEIAAQ